MNGGLLRAKPPGMRFPIRAGARWTRETCALKVALKHRNVSLRTGCRAVKLWTDNNDFVTAVGCEKNDQSEKISAPIVILAAGAVQTAALLLASANDDHPTGLANGSDLVGRNFMNHNCSAVLAVHPLRHNRAIYQKTLMVNDFYLSSDVDGLPLGNIQMLGKVTGPILSASSKLPRWLANMIATRSFDFYAMSEDLPRPDSRVTLKNGQIKLTWKRSNWNAHEQLVEVLKSRLRKAGFPIVISRPFDRPYPIPPVRNRKDGLRPAGQCCRYLWPKSRPQESFHCGRVDPTDLRSRQSGADNCSTGSANRKTYNRNGVCGMSGVTLVTGGQQGIGLGIAKELI